MSRQVELLAPAGSFDSMKAAFNAGADAVYIGGRQFGARAYADNTTDVELLSAIDYAHLRGKFLYLTVNTLVKDSELDELCQWMKPLYEAGLDAAIVQDMGVFSLLRREFPLLNLHASTQMTVTGPDGAALLKKLGAVRVVPARELSIRDLRELYEATGMEVEAFIHGALCYAYSGQCLFSSLIGGRSGNRGRCAQACRLPYTALKNGRQLNRRDEPCLLSLKDLCTLDVLPEMLDAGVYSLKIEGRMKSPLYTAGVTAVYRKYVDRYLESGSEGYRVDEKDRRILTALFDRGGTTDGYLRGKTGCQMVALKEKPDRRIVDEALLEQIKQDYLREPESIFVMGKAEILTGKPAALTVWDDLGNRVTVNGATVEPAKNRPLTAQVAEKQLRKTGGSAYDWKTLEILTDEKGFLPLQELNRLRRESLQAIHEAKLARWRRKLSESEDASGDEHEDDLRDVSGDEHRDKPEEEYDGESGNEIRDDSDRAGNYLEKNELSSGESAPEIYVYPEELSVLRELLDENLADGYYLPLETMGADPAVLSETAAQIKAKGRKVFFAVPAVFRRQTRMLLQSLSGLIRSAEPDGLLVRTLDSLAFCRNQFPEIPLIADYSVYTYNRPAWEMISGLGASRRVLPVELNYRELKPIGTGRDELIAYGRIPVMYSANCIQKTVDGCSRRPETLWLRDRKNKKFPVKNHCSLCFNTIYNSSPLHLLDDREQVMNLSPAAIRLILTTEDGRTARELVRAYCGVYKEKRRTDYRIEDFTRGHYRRGIE